VVSGDVEVDRSPSSRVDAGSTNPFDGMRSDVDKCAEIRAFRGNVASCTEVENEGEVRANDGGQSG
jgi:hypothetical protein